MINYTKKNNLELEVILNPKNINKQIKFYKNIYKKIKFSNTKLNSYENLKNDAIIVGMESTLVRESFGRNYKVLFLNIRKYYLKENFRVLVFCLNMLMRVLLV